MISAGKPSIVEVISVIFIEDANKYQSKFNLLLYVHLNLCLILILK